MSRALSPLDAFNGMLRQAAFLSGKRRETRGGVGMLVAMQPPAVREALKDLRAEHLQGPRLDVLAGFCEDARLLGRSG